MIVAILESEKIESYILLSILTFLSIGLLNISTYRNFISVETIKIYSLAFSLIIAPRLLAPKSRKISMEWKTKRLFEPMMYAHIIISWIALLYIYARVGPIIINQDLRFQIPTSFGYIIRSCQFIPLYLFATGRLRISSMHNISISLFALLPTILIASRSTVFLVLLAIFFFWLHQTSNSQQGSRAIKNPLKNFLGSSLIFLAAIILISGGFYLRRASTSELLDGLKFVEIFMGNYPKFLTVPLAPFHQGFNEAAALTSRIVDFGYSNQFTPTPLIFADFDNLLGRSNISAAQYFGNLIGRAQDGGLTPGIVGSVLLDYRGNFHIVFLIIGITIYFLKYLTSKDQRWMTIYIIFMVSFMHLLLRGFIKPEYISNLIIATCYMTQVSIHRHD